MQGGLGVCRDAVWISSHLSAHLGRLPRLIWPRDIPDSNTGMKIFPPPINKWSLPGNRNFLSPFEIGAAGGGGTMLAFGSATSISKRAKVAGQPPRLIGWAEACGPGRGTLFTMPPPRGGPPSQMGDLRCCPCKQLLSFSLSSTRMSNYTCGERRRRALWLSSSGECFTSTHSSPSLLHQLEAELTV